MMSNKISRQNITIRKSFAIKCSINKAPQPKRGSNPKPNRDFSRSVKTILQLSEDPAAVRDFYQKIMIGFPDVMNVSQVTKFIGYNRQTIGRWIICGKLKALKSMNQHMIPKTYLLDFLLTDTFNQIVRKAPEHERMLWELTKKDGPLGPQEGVLNTGSLRTLQN